MMRYFTYIIFIFTMQLATAQEMHIKSRLDTNLIVIGDQAKLTIDVQYPKNMDVSWPLMQDTVSEKVEIVDLSLDTIFTQEDIHHFLIQYTITSFDSGYYVIPPQLIIDTKNNDTLESQALRFAVATLVLDTTKQNAIFDIKAPMSAPWTFSEFMSEYYPYMLMALLLIALIVAVVWYLKKQKNKAPAPVKKVIPKEAAHIIALRELEQLKEKKLWQNDRVKLYYIELSDIVRNYLEHRFKIKTLEQTSQEIYDAIERGKILTNEQLVQLKQILSTADMAKFAKAKPLANENDLALKNAFELIEKTKLLKSEEEPKQEKIQKQTDNTIEPKQDETTKEEDHA